MMNQEVPWRSGFLWLMMSMFLLDEWTAGQRVTENHDGKWAETRGKEEKKNRPNINGEKGRQEANKSF
jgi:hypothetical protein